MQTSRLRVTLREVTPVVVRVVDVPYSTTLAELHELLQAALGWTDHLHEFAVGEQRYGVPDDGGFADDVEPPMRDEAGARLKDLGARFVYSYDFGDGWIHDVAVLGRGGDAPGCVYGEGMCPPEDCGGPSGYARMCEVLADPAHDEHDSIRQWAGELVDFDQADTDLLIRHTVGEVPASVRLVLELLAGGVRLTPGGRLPRALVRAVQQHRPRWSYTQGPAAREEDLVPLAALHELLREVGLVRLRHGILAPTRAAGDELAVIRRLRSWFAPDDSFATILAGVTVAMLVHHGPQHVGELARRVYPWVDHGWIHRDGTPATEADVKRELHRLGAVVQGLDLIEPHGLVWSAGGSARTVLPRATGLAHLWDQPRYRDPDLAEHDPAALAPQH